MNIKRFWILFFSVKVFYLFFAFFVYAKLTSLGDTSMYYSAGMSLSSNILYSSTAMMSFTGSVFKRIFVLDVLASIPCLILSFYGIYYAIERLNLYRYPKLLLLVLILPNFGVWTSIHSKEAVGCFFTAVIGVLLIRFINKDFKVRLIDIVALYLCLIFKPQYLLFILQALVFLRFIGLFQLDALKTFVLGLIIVILNFSVIFFFREMIDSLAKGMYVHFSYSDPNLAKSTRTGEAWMEENGFLKEAPYGMFIAFWGPTIKEMFSKPTHLISGIESFIFLGVLIQLAVRRFKYIIFNYSFNPTLLFTYFIVIAGILFVHYPFGYLNPGSAIRYRENFYILFVILMFYLFDYNRITSLLKK